MYIKLTSLVACYLFAYSLSAQCVGTQGQVSWLYWGDIDGYSIDNLYVDDTYPQGPDQVRILTSLMTPKNYNNHYGAITKGFVSVPETSSVTFNITSDDASIFYLSSDESAANLDSLMSVTGWTSSEEHTKYPEQTSKVVSMVANQLYYFEIHHYEGGSGDHVAVYWQRPFVSHDNWQLITSPFLTDVCDAVCPPKGTACDDGDSSTSDDIQDGSCNCVGTPISQGATIGQRGMLDAYFYDDIGGGSISTLYEDPDFPTMPDRLSIYPEGLRVEWENNIDEFGMMMEGYLTVPVSGCYDFNITGVAQTRFFISASEDPSAITDSIYTRWGVARYNHDHPSFDGSQTMTNICLEQGRFYYFRLLQVNPSWGYHVSVFWHGPQHQEEGWNHIPEIFLYNYEDELACLPEGYSCDDGNPLTRMDQIQADCSCAGTPCTPQVDCDDPSASYDPYDYCETSDILDTRADDAWLSCDAGINPFVVERSGFHWIHYDLGRSYLVGTTHIWNYNVSGQLNQGFEQVAVDYSVDGSTWYHLGDFSWPQATGNSSYLGFDGPDFQQVQARYIMFTSLDDPGSCRGISKATFTVHECASRGSMCDDGDQNTYQDHINAFCQCEGYTLEQLDCAVDTMYISQDDMTPETYHAISALMSEGKVLNGASLHYKAGMEIVLEAGFEVTTGGALDAAIEDCPSSLWSDKDGRKIYAVIDSTSPSNLLAAPSQPNSLEVFQLEDQSDHTVHFNLRDPSHVRLELFDSAGHMIMRLANHRYNNRGDFYKRLQTKRLAPGVYMLKMWVNHSDPHISRITVH